MLPKIELSAKGIFGSGKELFLGILFGFLWWPGFLFLCLINITLRSIVQRFYNLLHGKGHYIITDGEDGLFGHKIKGNSNSMISGWQVIKGKPNLKLMRDKYSSVIKGDKDYSRFGYIFTHKFGYFCWKKDTKFDIKNHIRILEDFDITKEADERKLMDLVGNIVVSPMRGDKPQWEILLVPKYRPEGSGEEAHYALITLFSHAYSDAISYFLMVNNYIADSPAELPMDPTTLPFKVPLWAKVIIWGKALILGPYLFCCIMITYIFDKSVFSVMDYSATKICSRSPSISLETVRKIKKESGASVTAILYTALYSALHKSHEKVFQNVQVPPKLELASVVALFPYWGQRKLGNQYTLWPYSAPLSIKGNCLKERLKGSDEITRRGVQSACSVFNFHLSRFLGSLPKFVHPLMWKLSGCPIMLSNVPGFSSRLKIYGGEMTDACGFLPLMSTVGLGLSTTTYCGDFRFNCVADPKVFCRADLEDFLFDVIREMEELARIYDVKPDEISHLKLVKKLDENENYRKNLENLFKTGNDLNNEGKKAVKQYEEDINVIGKCIQSL